MEIASPPEADRNDYSNYIGFEFGYYLGFGAWDLGFKLSASHRHKRETDILS